MAPRLMIVSNRLPMGDAPSGGLVVALHDVLAKSGGCWIGAHTETGDASESLETIASEPYRRMAFRLTEQENEDYYLGFSNSVLWPLCHRRVDLVRLLPAFLNAYEGVNCRLARMIAGEAKPDDIIWVQDYHFIPLAKELRKLGIRNRIGFFLHVPFPVLADLSILPKSESFADDLAHYNLIGLQTRGDVARCLEMYRADPRAEFLSDGKIKYFDRITSVRSFPIGIDVAGFREDAERPTHDPFGAGGPDMFAIGVDRLDYTKGLANRFYGFSRYLAQRPTGAKPCLLQIAQPTRQRVQAYQNIKEELQGLAGQINGEFAELDWTPVRYIHRGVERSRLAQLYRRARACLVTSLADGMNLVAKEYIAAQNPDDPGVLILSRFAGAAEDMTEALLINPYDVDDIAQAIAQAFDMPLEERLFRFTKCMEVVERTDAATWSEQFIGTLVNCEPSFDSLMFDNMMFGVGGGG